MSPYIDKKYKKQAAQETISRAVGHRIKLAKTDILIFK